MYIYRNIALIRRQLIGIIVHTSGTGVGTRLIATLFGGQVIAVGPPQITREDGEPNHCSHIRQRSESTLIPRREYPLLILSCLEACDYRQIRYYTMQDAFVLP